MNEPTEACIVNAHQPTKHVVYLITEQIAPVTEIEM